MTRRIGYARVSTTDQRLDLQLDALRAAGCTVIYRDIVSGAQASRPGLTRTLKALHPGDELVVWKLDRLGRTTHQLVVLLERLEQRGVRLRSLQDGIDPSTIMGKAMLQIGAVFAEMERNLIRERTKAGMKAAQARGITLGRPPKLTPKQIEKARAWEKAGATRTAIADRLRVSPATLRRALGTSARRSPLSAQPSDQQDRSSERKSQCRSQL